MVEIGLVIEKGNMFYFVGIFGVFFKFGGMEVGWGWLGCIVWLGLLYYIVVVVWYGRFGVDDVDEDGK